MTKGKITREWHKYSYEQKAKCIEMKIEKKSPKEIEEETTIKKKSQYMSQAEDKYQFLNIRKYFEVRVQQFLQMGKNIDILKKLEIRKQNKEIRLYINGMLENKDDELTNLIQQTKKQSFGKENKSVIDKVVKDIREQFFEGPHQEKKQSDTNNSQKLKKKKINQLQQQYLDSPILKSEEYHPEKIDQPHDDEVHSQKYSDNNYESNQFISQQQKQEEEIFNSDNPSFNPEKIDDLCDDQDHSQKQSDNNYGQFGSQLQNEDQDFINSCSEYYPQLCQDSNNNYGNYHLK